MYAKELYNNDLLSPLYVLQVCVPNRVFFVTVFMVAKLDLAYRKIFHSAFSLVNSLEEGTTGTAA